MPQARSGGSRKSSSSSGSSSSGSRSTRSSSGSRSTGSRSTGARSTGARSTRAKSTRSGSTSRASTSGRSRSTAGRSRASSTRAGTTAAADARVEAVAQRIRKLNDRIIEAGKEGGETMLTSYEKALKSIASTIEKGPGSSDVEWISNLATAQAKFIRDVTTSWTAAARKMLK